MMVDAAVTDVVLATTCLGFGLRLLRAPPGAAIGGIGMLLVGIAAMFGSARYGFAASLAPAHEGVGRLAGMVGIPLIGVGWGTQVFAPQWANALRAPAFVILLIAAVALIAVDPYQTLIASVGITLVILAALSAMRTAPRAAGLGLLGALGALVAGLAVDGDSSVGPMRRIAWFHLLFAASMALLAVGLVGVSEDQSGAESDP